MTGPAPSGEAARSQRAVGVVEEVAPGVRRILAPNPGLMTGPGTNTYLLGDGPVALIDPGPDDDAHLVAILEAVGDRLRYVIATHTHVDHSPLARRLREATGAQVVGFGPAPALPAHHHPPIPPAGGAGEAAAHSPADAHDLDFSPDRRLGDGDRLRVGAADLVAVHTPGHCSNHLCVELAGSGLLFSGDHVMSGSTVVIAPPDGDMADYMESLERIRSRRPTRIAPGHGDMIDDPAAALDEYLTHRRSRERQVLDGVLAAGGAGTTAEALVALLYAEVPSALHPVARYSVWAHLRKLGAEGAVRGDDPDDVGAPWRAAVGP
ncbi:MBL fold metallo-hydrolase [Acidiferrimicrobium sp. IK]|uniref:MBL fold metallo-hydrolase n=1 Tax=Acidiferrimicrobium sp. IK TaxID=2871700 RepID=UPI0021CB8699|nr:MBL fold metallo-hydrolase [Acidiferrimicrobium sp. IK]MCU4186232.1 MBL fold metallo-hydrolase [Acidiferrimicrobium sp. IK]